MRKTLVVLGLVAAASLAMGTSAMAKPTKGDGSQRQARMENRRDRFEQLKKALAQVGLSADQQKKVDTIVADAKAQLQTLRESAKSGGDKEQLKTQAKDIVQKAVKEIREVLTPEQKTKLRELMSKEHGGKAAATKA